MSVHEVLQILEESLVRIQEYPWKDWSTEQVQALILRLKKALKAEPERLSEGKGAKKMKITKLRELILDALICDGEHHKQWYLEEIGKECGIDIEKEYKLATEHQEWERGIPP